MSKNRGGGEFQNSAAKKFKNLELIPTMDQEEIFDILDDNIDIILEQTKRSLDHMGKFPMYILNAFANLSTALWFYCYVADGCKQKKRKVVVNFDEDDREALKNILYRAYKKSVTNFFAQQTQEFEERNRLISDAFVLLDHETYELTKKLNTPDNKISKLNRRDMTVQVYGNPVHGAKYIYRSFDESSVSSKKKLKLLKKLYGDRYYDALGALLTCNNNKSDLIGLAYDTLMRPKGKKKRRLKAQLRIMRAYAIAYKTNQTQYFKMAQAECYTKFKDIIGVLIMKDIGFKKAFKAAKTAYKKQKTKAM